jgi:hypothetical protein
VCPKTSTSQSARAAIRSKVRGFVFEQVLVHLPRRAVDEPDAFAAEFEAEVEGQLAHEVLRSLVGVCERPLDGQLSDLSVVRGDVGAAAVVEVAADRVVVVAVEGWDRLRFDRRADFVRVRSVADQVAAAVDAFHAESLDFGEGGLERRQVRMDVGDHGDPGHRRARLRVEPDTARVLGVGSSVPGRRNSQPERRAASRPKANVSVAASQAPMSARSRPPAKPVSERLRKSRHVSCLARDGRGRFTPVFPDSLTRARRNARCRSSSSQRWADERQLSVGCKG